MIPKTLIFKIDHFPACQCRPSVSSVSSNLIPNCNSIRCTSKLDNQVWKLWASNKTYHINLWCIHEFISSRGTNSQVWSWVASTSPCFDISSLYSSAHTRLLRILVCCADSCAARTASSHQHPLLALVLMDVKKTEW